MKIMLNRQIGLVVIALFFSSLWAATDTNDLYTQKLQYKTNVYQKTLDYVQNHPDSPDIAKLWFNVAELSTEVEAGNPDKIVEYYRKVIEKDPYFPDRDAVYYNIGYYAYRATKDRVEAQRVEYLNQFTNTEDFSGKYPPNLVYSESTFGDAVTALNEILSHYPNSRYYSDALFRLGNLYLEIGYDNPEQTQQVEDSSTHRVLTRNVYYTKADSYFKQLADRKDRMSIYGTFFQGWTSFSTGDYNGAIRYFSATLDSLANTKDKQMTTYFESNALENIASSLMEFDSTYVSSSQAAQKFRDVFSKMVTPEYGQKILKEAFALKMHYRAPQQAIDFYNVYVSLYPEALDAPSLIDSIIVVAMNNEDLVANAKKVVSDQRKRLVDNYNTGSAWYTQNKDKDITAQLAIIRDAFDKIEINEYNDAVDQPTDEHYSQYMTVAENYLKIQSIAMADSSAKHNAVQQRMMNLTLHKANVGKNPVDYYHAMKMFWAYNDQHPANDSLFTFESRSYYCAETIFTSLREQVVEAPFVSEKDGINWTRDGLDSLYTTATDRYEKVFTDPKYAGRIANDDVLRILNNRAGVAYDRKNYDAAYDNYQLVLTRNPNKEMEEVAYSRMAEIAYNRGGQQNFDLAEQYYTKAAAITTDKERKKAYESNRYAAMQAKAGTMSGSDAAAIYLNLAEENKAQDVELAIGYYAKAIDAYKKAGLNQDAINTYLKIVDVATQKDQLTAAYLRAYTLADSTNDYPQGERLRRDLIAKLNAKYPGSIEAYQVELDIINHYESAPYNDKEKAAELYLDLHNRAVSTKMNIGDKTPADIYINVIRLYDAQGDEAKMIESMLAFEKLYPNDARSNDFLKRVASIYEKNGQEDKLNDLAIYMYKKDPTLNLYEDIAKRHLRENLEQAQKTFDAKQMDNLQATQTALATQRAEYDKLVAKYRANKLNLQYDLGYNQYRTYENYFNFFTNLRAATENVENVYLKKAPNSFVPVVPQTTWNGQLMKGRRYPEKAIANGQTKAEELYKVLTDGLAEGIDVPTAERTHVLYLCGRINDYVAEAIATQIQKYVNTSIELKAYKADPTQFDEAVQAINEQSTQFQFEAWKNAAGWYDLCLSTFVDNKTYSDTWTDKCLARLTELGVRKPQVTVDIVSDGSWGQVTAQAPQQALAQYPGAQFIALSANQSTTLQHEFDARIIPMSVNVTYLSEQPLDLYMNGQKLAMTPQQDTLRVDGKLWNRYSLTDTEHSLLGRNDVALIAPASANSSSVLFDVQVAYEKATYDQLSNVTPFQVLADGTWMTTTTELDPTAEVVIDSTTAAQWKPATTVQLGYTIPGMTKYDSIWAPKDSTNAQTVYFYKEFDLADPAMQTTLRYFADQNVSIWFNMAPVTADEEMAIDADGQHAYRRLATLPVIQGKNTILVKVTGGNASHGLIFELNGITQKME